MPFASEPTRSRYRNQTQGDESPLAYSRWLLREKQFQQAIQTCRAALKNGEDSAELHETLGRALLLSGDAESSLWHFLQATVLAPTQASGFISLGAAYNQLQRFESAVDVLIKAVKIKPSATAYYNLGFAYRYMNNLSSAKTAYREALRLDPNSADAHHNLAGVYVELRELTLAITHYQKVLELRPSFPRAVEGLRKATLAMSQPKESLVRNEPAVTTPTNSSPSLSAKVAAAAMDPKHARFLGRDIVRAAHDLQQHFENTIIPLLNHMRRLVSEGRCGSDAFQEQQKNYRTACQQNSQLRKTLRLLFLRLFATDELARTSPKT